MPIEMEYIWKWFCRLNRERQVGMAICALPSTEITAWQRRHQIDIDPFEHEIIERIDDLYVAQQNKKVEK